MAIVSDVEIRLRADIARLQQDMDRARTSVTSTMGRITVVAKAAMGALAAIGGAFAFGAFIKSAIDATDAVSDVAQKTGLAVEQIAGLQLWFQKGGTEAGTFETTMVKLAKSIAEGGDAFRRLGVSTTTSNGELRSNVDVLMDSADAFAAMQDGTTKTALAVQLFGKTGADLIPMLNEGSAGLRAMNEMAERLGLTFDQKTVDQAGEFNDTLSFLGLAAQGVGRKVAAELLPTLQSLAGKFLEFITTSNAVTKAAQAIGIAFKVIYTAGSAIVTLFNVIGKVIGGTMAFITNNLTTLFTALRQGIEGDYAKAWQTITTGGVKAGAILGSTFTGVKDELASAATNISDVWTGAGGETVAALAKITKQGKYTSEEAAKDAKKQADAYAELISGLRMKADASAREASGAAALNEAEKDAIELTDKLARGKLVLTAAQEARARSLIEENRQHLASIESQKALVAMNESLGKAAKEVADARAATIKTATDEAERNEELAKTFGMTATQVERLELARLKEQLAQRSSKGLTLDEIEDLERLIALKERSVNAVASVEAMQQTKDFWSSIEKTAHDTFVSIADGGKDTWKRLKDTAKNTFFDWLYQQTLKKWIINIQTSTTGGGLASLFGSSTSGAGGGTDMGSLLSMGKTIYNGFSTGFASVGSGIGTYVSALGNTFGSSAVSAFGSGMGLTSAQAAQAAAAYNSAGMASTGSAISAGSAAGSVASVAAGAAIGHYGGRAISNGFSAVGGSGNSLTNTGTIAGMGIGYYVGGPMGAAVGAALGGVIGGALNRAFGHKKREYEDAILSGNLGLEGLTGGKMSANWVEKGGWFRSDKRGTEVEAISKEMTDVLTGGFNAIKAVTIDFATVFGQSADVVAGYSKSLNFAVTKDAAKNEAMLTELFTSIGEDLAARVIPNIAMFKREGESAAQTMERLAGSFQVVNGVLVTLGVTSQQAFGAVGVASIEARERLIGLAGGVQNLATQTQYFADNFLSTAEQIAPAQHQLTEQLAALGYGGLQTADQFKKTILGLAQTGALATEAGAGLLALAPAFKTVTDAMLEMKRAAADDALGGLGRAVDAQKDVVTAAYESAMTALETQLDGVNDKVQRTTELSRALREAMGTVDTPDQQAAARGAASAQIQAAIAIAKASGVLPSTEDLRDALATLQMDAADSFSSLVDYQREVARTNAQLDALGGLTDDQLSNAEKQLALLQAQKDEAVASNVREMSRLDSLVTGAQAQLDALNGVNNGILSVDLALGNVYQAIRDLKQQSGGFVGELTGVAPPMGPVAMGVPVVASYTQSGTMGGSAAAMQEVLERMESRLASIEISNATGAQASDQLARQFNDVSGGGNTLLVQPA